LSFDDSIASDWCDLEWTSWHPLDADHVRTTAPGCPGVYRIRRARETKRLAHIGQTGRTLQKRVTELTKSAHQDECPYNDPHTAAPHFWLMTRFEGAQLEFSCAPVAGDQATRRGIEDVLLWRHRLKNRCSTEANHGRFYPGWSRPSNKKEGRKAAPLPGGRQGPNFDISASALEGNDCILSASWWSHSAFSEVRALPNEAAIYCVFDGAAIERGPLYVGETFKLKNRAMSHQRSRWPAASPTFAYRIYPGAPKHFLHELECDLLGWHFWRSRSAPCCQYRGEHNRPE
jgi:hypothetical protein